MASAAVLATMCSQKMSAQRVRTVVRENRKSETEVGSSKLRENTWRRIRTEIGAGEKSRNQRQCDVVSDEATA